MQVNKTLKVLLVGAGVIGAGAASAALPTDAATAFTTLGTNVADTLTAVWVIVVASVGGFALIKLFKKGASKAI